ncbi:MAG: hypothetical protein AB7F35_27715 [Acetobacteraceae bacterium]
MPALVLLASVALADPPGKSGGHGHGNGHDKVHEAGVPSGKSNQQAPQGTTWFSAGDQTTIRAYFAPLIASGNCPPGLAKKQNGCLPPGQARRWTERQVLPAGIELHPLPPDLLVRLSPPRGYTYMRSGTDILMIAAGTNMVVAGLRDLLR